jgi:hypothetical protein
MLAKTRMSQGAAAFGILMTSQGAGMLLGSVLSVQMTRLTRGRLGMMVLSLDALNGLAFAALSITHSVLIAGGLLVLVGTFVGTMQIAIITWLQHRVPHAMLGRTMSLVMFTFMGLAPLSAAVAGGLLKVLSLTSLLVIAGLALTGIALFCLTRPSLRAIRLQAPSFG